jgi:2-phosphosulfolactate phosphatase
VRLDVFLGYRELTPADVAGRVVAVIDVLRASTTIAVALSAGARQIIPFESSEEVVSRSKAFERREVRLAGERRMLMVPGFDLGNSPLEFTPETVGGQTVLMTTSNGTGALLATAGARDVVVASYVNFSAAIALLRAAARGGSDVSIVCAGRDRQFSLEDAACAGRYARHIMKRLANVEINDAARACMLIDARYRDNVEQILADSSHGKALEAAGFADDLKVCASLDAYPVLPMFADRQITQLGPDRER